MPSFGSHPAMSTDGRRGIYKGLHVGDTGTGKTGALASLIDEGYRLAILDFDRGLDPIAGYTKKQELLGKNVFYETLTDKFKLVGQTIVVEKAGGFSQAMKLMDDWPGLGPAHSWGDDTILVIDTLGSMSRASFHMVLKANNIMLPSGTRGGPEMSHYGTAMDNIERFLLEITDPAMLPCHLIVNAHWTFQEDGAGNSKFYPEAIGQKLNPKIGRNFNTMLGFSLSGAKRSIKTQRDGLTAMKTAKPLKPEYPLETGLADIFREVVGPPPLGA